MATKTKMRVVVLISPDYAATYFANQLMKHTNIVGVFVEKQHRSPLLSEKIIKTLRLTLRPRQTLKTIYDNKIFNHYNRDICGKIDLKEFGIECTRLFPGKNCKTVYTEGARQINNPIYVEQMRQLQPDVIAICGTSIIKDQIINLPAHGVLNLHTGLPQKYRGVSTNPWAIYNKEPEYIGSTVHFVDPGVDTGNIIYQGRPHINYEDDPETLNVKAVKLGTKMMIQAIKDIEAGTIQRFNQMQKGQLYLEKTFNAEILKKIWDNYEMGIIREYVKNKTERDKKVVEVMVGSYFESYSNPDQSSPGMAQSLT
jgi:methionyl-tRNA formyltransferase